MEQTQADEQAIQNMIDEGGPVHCQLETTPIPCVEANDSEEPSDPE